MERGWQYGRELYEDRLIQRIERLYLLWIVVTFGRPFLVGYLAGGMKLNVGWVARVWGGRVPSYGVPHASAADGADGGRVHVRHIRASRRERARRSPRRPAHEPARSPRESSPG